MIKKLKEISAMLMTLELMPTIYIIYAISMIIIKLLDD